MLEKIREIITQYVEVAPESITEETSLRGGLEINSYEFMTIIGALEEQFGIEIPDRILSDFQTVGDLIVYIENETK